MNISRESWMMGIVAILCTSSFVGVVSYIDRNTGTRHIAGDKNAVRLLREDALTERLVIGDSAVRHGEKILDTKLHNSVVVIVFTDYQCGACIDVDHQLVRLQKRFPDKLRVLHRHFPLKRHEMAYESACAAEAAARQGKFRDMHNALFQCEGDISRSFINASAKSMNLDTAQFARDMYGVCRKAVNRDISAGEQMGIKFTPTMVVVRNGAFQEVRSLDTIIGMLEG